MPSRATPHRVATIVMAHPTRRYRAARLARMIGADVCLDPDPRGPPSATRTLTRCLAHYMTMAMGQTGGHLLVIQDDAVPCPVLHDHVARMTQRHPDALIALYTGHVHACRKQMLGDYKRAKRYTVLPLKHFVPTVALVWPSAHVWDFMGWLAAQDEVLPQDDEMVMRWRVHRFRHGQPVRAYGSIPSLVRHDNTQRSIMAGVNGGHGDRDALIPWTAWRKTTPWQVGW